MSASSYKELTQHINKNLGKLSKGLPDVLGAFHQLNKAANQDGALDKKTKELMAMALAVAARCDGCIGFHAQTLVKLGVTQEELNETLGLAVYMGGGPSLMYAAEAIAAFDEFNS